MAQGKRFSQADIDRILELHFSGLKAFEIAEVTGCALSSVTKYIKLAGHEFHPRNYNWKLIRCAEHESIPDLYRSGMTADEIGRRIGVSKPTVLKHLRQKGVVIRTNSISHRVYECDHRYFQEVSTPDKAYWLGYLAADGCVATDNTIVFSQKKSFGERVHAFRDAIGSNHPVKDRIEKDGIATVWAAKSPEMAKDLARFGIIPNKEQTLPWPNLSDDLYSHYLRGLSDGDGSFYVSKSSWQLGYNLIGSDATIQGCREYLIPRFGLGKTAIEKRNPGKTVSITTWVGNRQLFSFVLWLYRDSDNCLECKRRKVMDHYKSIDGYCQLLSPSEV